MPYTLSIWYKLSNEDEPQVHDNLSDAEAAIGLNSFSSDLFHLAGEGVRKITVEYHD